jgi:ABC-type lipoprotein export system ATPase subunit/GNAT superfamily N-acetyltransferase
LRRRREFFRVRQVRRTYDRASNKFTFNIAYQTAAQVTPRTVAVAEAFGLGLDEERKFEVLDAELKIGPRDIVYITGDSGTGKSVLLRALKQDLGEEAIEMADVRVDSSKPLIETVGSTLEQGLELLSRVGLNDAFLFLRTFEQLSDGQKYRYRLVKLVETGKKWWLCDEFCSLLDRDTAKIVAFNMQKLARELHCNCVVATTHRDLLWDLRPDVHVHKRFGKEINVTYCTYHTNYTYAHICSLVREMQVLPGTMADWRALASWHYRSHAVKAVRKIFRLMRGEELCGVIVYCYPPPTAFGRAQVLPKIRSFRELNKKLSTIGRIVVRPKYRTIGLGAYLIRETLPLAGTPSVEMVAVMAKYNPFAEKAGMRKIALQPSPKRIQNICRALQGLGFHLELLGSKTYNLRMLQDLELSRLEKVRQILADNAHPRLLKAFSKIQAFAKTAEYKGKVRAADLPSLAHLLQICSFLMQTKVYLFWQRT